MAWHRDEERELQHQGSIASVSFGATQTFAFRHIKTKQKVEVVLEPGSLLEMKDETQDHWHHRLPPTNKVKKARVNLTFRKIVISK